MKDVRMILPNLASDTAGAACALFPLNGLTVIHDAAGSMESYITFDEYRDLEGKRTVASRLSRLEAITGDDRILFSKLEKECADDPPPFIAILGSPVPFTIGTDLDGIAVEAEFSTGVPAFAANTGGFEIYDKGVGEALKKLLEKATRSPRAHEGHTVNLMGATPLDYSQAEIDGIRSQLLAQGATRVNTLTMTDGLDEVYHAAEADLNLVISMAGLPAARYMKTKYGISYSIGVPLGDAADGEQTQSLSETAPDRHVLILGESVLSKQLARACMQETGVHAVAGVTGNDDPEILPEVPCVRLDTEESICSELKKDYFAVVGDPLYKLLLPPNSKRVFIPHPHRALSSRLYPPCEHTLDHLIYELKRCFL